MTAGCRANYANSNGRAGRGSGGRRLERSNRVRTRGLAVDGAE